MTLRESFNAAIRSDRPESPTDIGFLYLVFILGMMWIYSNIKAVEIQSLAVMVGFISTLKLVKVGSDYQKKRKAVQDAANNGTVEKTTDSASASDTP